MNKGVFLGEEISNAVPTNFCIGVAGYPEKHFEAPNMNSDLRFLKKKVEQGAEYVVTQLFYDNQKFFQYVDLCRKNGIDVPIIPGLKPLTSKRQLNMIPHFFHVDLPDELSKAVENAKTSEEVKQIGIEWCIQQSKELKQAGVPVLHYYTMGKPDSVKAIAEAVF
jgi:methylenetetrahydrofolate reductase (NADPH)